MRKMRCLHSLAAPLPANDIDTDMILPARFLLLLDRSNLGACLFHDLRYGAAGERFILDTPPYDSAEILVAGSGFGTGSSREHAAWALADFGIRCIIATSFGEIFHANCIKSGLLPIILDPEQHQRVLIAAWRANPMSIDLNERRITLADGAIIPFPIDPQHCRVLLDGIDEIDALLSDDRDDIAAFEARQRVSAPWLHLSDDQLATFNPFAASQAR